MDAHTHFVPATGYKWIDRPSGSSQASSRWLVLASEDPSENTWESAGWGPLAGRRYDPMSDEPDLFFRFADLDVSEESLLSFADEFGWLGVEETIDDDRISGESWDAWRIAISDMKETLMLSQAAFAGDQSELRQRIELDDGDSQHRSVTWHRPGFREFALEGQDVDQMFHVPERDRLGVLALLMVATNVDGHLEGAFSGRLQFKSGSTDGGPRLDFHPSTLLSALWYQFALYLSGAREHRTCEFCETLFQIDRRAGPSGRRGRRDRKYCSSKCRKDASRARRG